MRFFFRAPWMWRSPWSERWWRRPPASRSTWLKLYRPLFEDSKGKREVLDKVVEDLVQR